MGSRDFYLNDTLYGDRVKAYKKLIEDIFNLIASDANIKPLPVKKFNHEINEMVDFERKLAQVQLIRIKIQIWYQQWNLVNFGPWRSA